MSGVLPYKPRRGEIPVDPGVYRFRDAEGRVLYVGKAKSLRQRLANYFGPLQALHERTRRMVTTASSVEWTTVATDVEALQLEYMWIKEYNPPFNVKYRDDKSYPFLVVTLAEESPRVFVTRNRKIRGAKYFGPYPKIWAVHETISLLLKVFPVRTCNDTNYNRAMSTGRPCFPGQIGTCGGPCSMKVTVEEHRRVIEQFIAFMSGSDTSIARELEDKMREASERWDFEEAARYRDKLSAVEAVLRRSALVLDEHENADVFGVADDELSAAVQQFIIRGGRVRGIRASTIDKEIDIPREELIDQILQRAYGEAAAEDIPRRVLVPMLPDAAQQLDDWLSERAGRRVHVRRPQRGKRVDLLQTATQNAQQALIRYKTTRSNDYVARTRALTELQEALGLDEAPLRIECFDISHLSGTNVVASMVVFEDGLARKDQYRSFKIASTTDDTDSMYQVLMRRLAHLGDDEPAEAPDGTRKRFAYPPQLLLVDGGQPQVAAAKRALKDSGHSEIPVAGIAKRLEELWLPDDDFPVILPRTSEALYLVQRLRDEAHRFAITHQRKARKRDIGSVLSEIPGLGPARVKAILTHFGSVAALRGADPDAISAVPGIGPALAATIHESLRSH